MNSVVFSSVLFFVCIATTVVMGQSGYFPYTELNGGKEEHNKACSKDEWADVLNEVFAASTKIGGRQLGTTAADPCACSLCIFSGRGCAKNPTRRRRRYLKDDANAAALHRTNMELCQKEIAAINATLNGRARSGKYSTSCRALIASPRKFTCREPTTCIVEYINLWDTARGIMIKEKMTPNGQKVCQSTPISFQAKVSFDNGPIRFDLYRSSIDQPPVDSRADGEAPYYMYGHNGTQIIGNKLEPGEYFLTVAAVNYTNSKTVSFKVDSC